VLINPKGLMNAGGYATFIGPGFTKQADTFTCAHCNKIVMVPIGKHQTDVGGGCWKCLDASNPLRNMICLPCVAKGTCTPTEKWLDTYEKAAMKREAVAGYFCTAG
jgi:hypothetical protein